MRYICRMESPITRKQFAQMLSATDRSVLNHAVTKLDKLFCRCGYVRHWVFNMAMGSWNPLLTEMDYEMRDVKTAEQLYDFLITRTE